MTSINLPPITQVKVNTLTSNLIYSQPLPIPKGNFPFFNTLYHKNETIKDKIVDYINDFMKKYNFCELNIAEVFLEKLIIYDYRFRDHFELKDIDRNDIIRYINELIYHKFPDLSLIEIGYYGKYNESDIFITL